MSEHTINKEETLQHISYPKIPHFKEIVSLVYERHKSQHKENHMNVPLPKITFYGSVKLHGSNASIVKDMKTGRIYAQSRSRVITPKDDNMGFAKFVEDNLTLFDAMFQNIDNYVEHYTHALIYGEWCGKGIQKGAAICELETKKFFIFAIREYSDKLAPEKSYCRNPGNLVISNLISNTPASIGVYLLIPSEELEIDFNDLKAAQSALEDITNKIEKECPVAISFGLSGVGEGLVWHADGVQGELSFKTKGSKHSDVKKKQNIEITPEICESIQHFVDAVVTDNRCEKMINLVMQKQIGESPIGMRNIGLFLKYLEQDIMAEESDRLEASGFEWKHVKHLVVIEAKKWFLRTGHA